MMKKILLLSTMSVLTILSSCEKDTLKDDKKIEGKWTLKSTVVSGREISTGNGSYLKFDGCSDVCSGEDYESTQNTKGLFTYEMSTDEKTLIIDDIMDEGGNWNGTWNVDEFTTTSLKLSRNTIFGNFSFKFTK